MAMFNPVTQKNSAIPSAQVVGDSGEKEKKTSFNRKKCLVETGLRRAAICLEQLGLEESYEKKALKQKLQKGTQKKMTGRKITQIMEQKIQRY